ncbi:nucleotidyltransferase family protein [Luteipulveratus halotolerans]|uniref:Molybdopterin-guanine dinucleotide biosynthesis protein MobA n=1 Tax=Luteipulveratus halotolerans TaxID=1631356 RepID=A0A0L6CNT8_9MICO|nr:NTP transferase domain-containing protein [Luteipulveratus halotolerans]KNX39315.1 molybdopterin-guanine dinucleotide biosynthesis protein MobA [Luteipulveratus halotolerans]
MTAAVLLAAGAGRRMGRPKALVEIDGEPLVLRAVRVLHEAGVDDVSVVVGARGDEVATLVGSLADVVTNPGWDGGMAGSLRAGLGSLDGTHDATLIHLVDLPWVTPEAVRRVVHLASPTVLARAAYDGVPGHPVLIGREHWDAVLAGLSGDQGARSWLAGRPDLHLVECGDVARGDDTDRPQDLSQA